MFDNLAQRFSSIFSGLSRQRRLTEENIDAGIREVRKALLEADVNLKVVREFVGRVREKAVGIETLKGVKPADQFVKIVQDEMIALLGGEETRIAWSDRGPTVIMMVGLQGTGKTTTTAKLARWLMKRESKKPMLVAADVQRPAAIEQLKVLGRQLDVPVYAEDGGRPPKICRRGVKKAEELGCDVVLLDTAGRLHIDDDLMDELEDIRDKVGPHEIWLAVDAMQGQDAVTSAHEFNQRLELSGVVLTKTDGDARGGAALAIREVTTKPIRYVGTGEKLDKLERFVPERMASRILGMGDVVSLVEQAQDVVDQEKAQEAAERLFMDTFTLEDMRSQFEQISKMGPMSELIKKLPGGQGLAQDQLGDLPGQKEMGRYVAAISSMTMEERMNPSIIHMQRRHRIARGSGNAVGVVNEVLKMHKQMKRQMKDLKKQGLMGRMADRMMQKQKRKKLKQMKKDGRAMGGWFR
ncbi:MAG: signal recognition particle protein [Planctomycetota bacterium]|nr:signal recognition particle protein [Planctomycetota bacterium]